MSGHLIWWSTSAVLLFWAVGAYNRLVRLRSEALRAFGALALALQRCADHVLSAVPTPPLPPQPAHDPEEPLAPGAAAPSAAVPWAGLLGAATQFAASLAVARAKPLDADAMGALSAANTVLRMAWQRVADECRAQPGAALPEPLLAQWDEIQRQMDHAGQDFAQTVQTYNAAVTQFPAALLAWLFGFRPARMLERPPP